jgi:hypothetical protein
MLTRTDFSGALYTLLAWVGQRVEVSIGATDEGPPLVATFAGRLSRGSDLVDADVTDDERYLFTFAEREALLLLDRSTFRGAWRDGSLLTIELGPLVVRMEPHQADEWADAA